MRADGPGNTVSINGMMPAPAPPGSMGPPSRPVEKATDIRSLEDTLAGTGVNIDEEERNLTATSFPSFGQRTPGSSFQTHNTSFGTNSASSSFENIQAPAGEGGGYGYGASSYLNQPSAEQLTPEEIQRRKENQANWETARHSQHALWKMFLAGDPLERRLNDRTYEQGIKSPKEGLYYATKGIDRPPQRTLVNGLDGASQIIDQGETILHSREGGTLGDVLKLISLAAKERMTGLVDLSARLAQERRDHSKGRVPTEWKSVAAVLPASPAGEEVANGLAAAPSMKRMNFPLPRNVTEDADNLLGTHSHANGDPTSTEAIPTRHKIAEIFRRASQADRAAEESRLAKRARRSASANPEATRSGSISAPSALDITSMSPLEAEKKTTKKDKKLAESKFTEAQQHKSANETARGALGSLIGKKGKSYSWMTGGTNTPKAVSSPVPTPARISAALAASNSSTPNGVRPAAALRGGQFSDWDEDKEPGIQARDLLLVLETDGRAPRSLMKGYNVPESRE